MRTRKLLVITMIVVMLSLTLALLVTSFSQSRAVQAGYNPDTVNSLADLTVQLSLDPPEPQAGQTFTVTLTIANVGAAPARDFCSYLYIDPSEEPPNTGTPDLYDNCLHANLYPGYSYSWSKPYTFAENGRHYIYAWVDKENVITEGNETNNTDVIILNDEPTPTPPPTGDTYEPDNSCGAARQVRPDGIHYRHTLWPVGDEDWIRVDMVQGVVYTITTSNVGDDGDTKIELYDLCDDPPLASDDPTLGQGAQLTWAPMFTGPHYIQVIHHESTYGSDTHYDLAVQAQVPGDVYEPNDTCITAREIQVGDVAQRHLFFQAGDDDWLRFHANGGQAYEITLSNVGSSAQPQIALYRSCGDSAFVQTEVGANLNWTAPAGGLYYVRIYDEEPASYGSTASYDVAVNEVGVGPEPGEPGNDDPVNALHLPVDGTSQSQRLSVTGDRDWFSFNADAGQTYKISTSNVGSVGDTVLCLYNPDLNAVLFCDDDSGPGRASKLFWRCPATGRYYLVVRDYRQDVGGSEVTYDIAVEAAASPCDTDSGEKDNAYHQAFDIPTDGTWYVRNTCPDGDVDWFRFWSPAGGIFAIETANLELDADTFMTLYDTDGQTVLWNNDDAGAGRESKILWEFQTEGVYYVKIEPYTALGNGQGTEYEVRVRPSTIAPTPTPTPTPPPTPTPTPTPTPPASAHTLIVTNRERLEAHYGSTAADQVMAALQRLAAHETVQGVVVDVNANVTTRDAYTAWSADLSDNNRANRTSDAVRNIIIHHRRSSPDLAYIVLVGNDLILPFRRLPERPWLVGGAKESDYADTPTSATTIRAAQQANLSLTDDYYACNELQTWQGQPLYLPDIALGRLVETPQDVVNKIDAYLTTPTVPVNRAFVAGYHHFRDGAQHICQRWNAVGVSGNDCALVSESWNATDLQLKQLQAIPRFELQALGIGTNHYIESSASGTRTYAQDIVNSTANLHGALIWNAGRYAGLNIPGSSGTELDLTEALARRGANYVGNTGTTFNNQYTVGQVERLMALFAQELTVEPQVAVGRAWMRAKRRYYLETPSFGEYDRKVMSVAAFYGLPMTQMETNDGTLGPEDDFPSVNIEGGVLGEAISLSLQLSLTNGLDALNYNSGTLGDHYDLDGHTFYPPEEAAQPHYYLSTTALGDAPARSVVWTGGVYTDVVDFTPLRSEVAIAGGSDMAIQQNQATLPSEPQRGWSPALPVTLRGTSSEMLGVSWGQYDEENRAERIYSDMTFDLYFSSSPDQTPPEVSWAVGRTEGPVGTIKIAAEDPSGIQRVVVVYTHNDGYWQSKDLRYDPVIQKWLGTVPTWRPVTWFAEVLDGAGNKTTVHNKGQYYHLEEIDTPVYRIYLPLAIRP